MTERERFENSLKLTKITFFFSGINIYDETGMWFWMIIFNFYLNFIWLYTDVIGEFYWLVEGIQVGKPFSELSFIAPCATICLLSTAKSAPLYLNRRVVLKILDKLRKMHPEFDHEELMNTSEGQTREHEKETAKEFTEAERKIVKNAVKFLNIVVRLLYYSSAVVVFVFSTLPIVSMGYDYRKKGTTDLKFPFLIKYFFDPFTKERWPFVYIHQVWSTFIASFNVFSADTFLYACCIYIQMHFYILSHRFQYVVCRSSRETRRRLLGLLRQYQELIEIVKQVDSLYSKSTLFNIITSSFLICLSAFNVTTMDDTGAVFAFLTFLFMSIAQISLLCLFGDMLMRSSTKVSESIYMSRWYEADDETRKLLLMIITRAQKPCKLTAARFADLNLTAFTTILSRSWSYFALLKTMYRET